MTEEPTKSTGDVWTSGVPEDSETIRIVVQDGNRPEFRYTLAPFGSDTPASAKDLASLHQELLPTSPAALLGKYFLESFYYDVLPREGEIFGAVAYIDDEAVGLVVCCEDSEGFMRRALKRHHFRLGYVLTRTLFSEPRAVGAFLEAWNLIRARNGSDELIGELMSLAVLGPYRGRDFKSTTGILIASDLGAYAFEEFRRRGTPLVRAIIDEKNYRCQRFSMGRGWALAETGVPGWKVPSVELRIRPEDHLVD